MRSYWKIHFGADVPHDWRGIIWKNARHRRQVADIAVHDAEEGGDRALIGGNRIEVTRQQFRSCGCCDVPIHTRDANLRTVEAPCAAFLGLGRKLAARFSHRLLPAVQARARR